MRGKSSGEYLQHLEPLLNRIFDGAEDERDRMAMLMLAKIRSIVGDDFKLHLSNRKIRTIEDLSSALEAWEIARGKLHHEDGYKHRRYVTRVQTAPIRVLHPSNRRMARKVFPLRRGTSMSSLKLKCL